MNSQVFTLPYVVAEVAKLEATRGFKVTGHCDEQCQYEALSDLRVALATGVTHVTGEHGLYDLTLTKAESTVVVYTNERTRSGWSPDVKTVMGLDAARALYAECKGRTFDNTKPGDLSVRVVSGTLSQSDYVFGFTDKHPDSFPKSSRFS